MFYIVDYPNGYYVSDTLEKAYEMLERLNGYMIRTKTLDLFPKYEVIYERTIPSENICLVFKVRKRNKRKKKYL